MASNNSLSLRSVLEKDNGANFIDSSRNLRSVLKQEKRLEVPNKTLPNELDVSCALGPNNVVIYLINKMRCDFI